MCLLCEEPDVPELDGCCPACLVPFRIEVVSGLRQLGDYLARWAAFDAWCDRQNVVPAGTALPG